MREFKEAVSEFKNRAMPYERMDITEEMELMIEVDDIMDELQTLKQVLTSQQRVVGDLNRRLFMADGSSVYVKTMDSHLSRINAAKEAAKMADTSVSLFFALSHTHTSPGKRSL